jgi:hypothetical protein
MYNGYLNNITFKNYNSCFFKISEKVFFIFNGKYYHALYTLLNRNGLFLFSPLFVKIFFCTNFNAVQKSSLNTGVFHNICCTTHMNASSVFTFKVITLLNCNSAAAFTKMTHLFFYKKNRNFLRFQGRTFKIFKNFINFSKRAIRRPNLNIHVSDFFSKRLRSKKHLKHFMPLYQTFRKCMAVKKKNYKKNTRELTKRVPKKIRFLELDIFCLFLKILNKDSAHFKGRFLLNNCGDYLWYSTVISCNIGDLAYVNAANLFLFYTLSFFKNPFFCEANISTQYKSYTPNRFFDLVEFVMQREKQLYRRRFTLETYSLQHN